jgi:putative hydrolase of the HAD superfamily
MKNKYVFVFDLDDTLYKEIDFLKSAYICIASKIDKQNSSTLYQSMLEDYYAGENVFKILNQYYPQYTINKLLELYRGHHPNITLDSDTSSMLKYLKSYGETGLITDGRSITQRNKIKALGLEDYFDKILISEEMGYSKPDFRLFQQFHEYNANTYFYIANDTSKDFLAPNQLGWKTICLIDSNNINIKKQEFNLKNEYLPIFKINKLSDLKEIINNE